MRASPRPGPDPVLRDRLMASAQARARARRRVFRRRRQVAAAGLLLCCTLIAMAGLRVAHALTTGRVGGAGSRSPAPVGTSAPPVDRAASSPTSSATASTRPSLRTPDGFARASGGTVRHGSGPLRIYRVEVETRTGQSASAFAALVDATLVDPSSWTGQGKWSFQRVDGDDVDFVIRLATPGTVDHVCATAGLDTRGYVSCRSGHFVMINLDRWLHAVPDYHGDVARYRHYVVNHEVGHELGYGHQTCPGPGHLAPVMQQQTFGLHGCLANGWPYVEGKLVLGPPSA